MPRNISFLLCLFAESHTNKMQAALIFVPSSIPFVGAPTKKLVSPLRPVSSPRISLINKHVKATLDAVPQETSEVDYNSMTTSVFPAEACETIGGEACDVEMYPEVKLKAEVNKKKPESASEKVDREYLDYNSSKTVFPGEACDDLGGEFCEPEYQKGVY